MYAFNVKGQITKYDTPMDILKEFYDVRLEYYAKRKDHMLVGLQHDMDMYNNKARFIQEVVSESLKVHKMKKDELENYLQVNKYKQFNNSYDYITRIPIYNLTKDSVHALEADIAKMKAELAGVKKKTPEQMWLEDIDTLGISS